MNTSTCFTDASDPKSKAMSRVGYSSARRNNDMTHTKAAVVDHIVHRDYGDNATTAQGLFLLAGGSLSPIKDEFSDLGLAPKSEGWSLLRGIDLPDHCTTKEINILIRVLDGRIGNPGARMEYIMGMSVSQVADKVRYLIDKYGCTTSNGRVNLPAGGIQGLKGFFLASELLPRVSKQDTQPEAAPGDDWF